MANNLATTTAEADARLINVEYDSLMGVTAGALKAGDILTRCWPNIDATAADTLIVALADSTTITNPKADNQTYTGTFARSAVWGSEPSDDDGGQRKVTIYEKLTKIVSSTGTLPDPIQMAETEILDAFSLKEGTRYMVGYKYLYLNPAQREEFMALAITAPTVPSSPPGGVLYVEKDRKFDVQDKGDRTATLTVLFFRMVWNAFAEASPDHTHYDNYGTEHQRITEEWYNVTVENGSALSALYTGDTDYNVMRVKIRDNKNGSMDVTREQWHEAIGASGAEIEEDRVKLINPFALQYGTLTRLTVVNENMLASASAYGTPTGSDWTTVDTYEEFTQSGLWNKYYIFEKVTWSLWGHDSGAVDTTEYDNAGTGNERERITKTWFGIANSYAAAATTALRNGTTHFAATTGYIITNAGVRDNQDGSITLVQVQKKQVNDKDAGVLADPIQDMINPHGWDGGTISAIHTHYEHFTATGLATAIDSITTPDGYVLAQVHETIDGDGLYSRVYRYELPSFTNSKANDDNPTTHQILENIRIFGYRNYDPDVPLEGLDVKRIDGGDGIPIGDIAEVLANEPTIADHTLDSVDIRDNGNGSASYRRTQTKQRGTGDKFYRHWVAANGRQEEQETVLWTNLTDAAATTVYTDAKDNSTDMEAATFAASRAGHKLRTVDRIPHDNGLVDVLRVSFIPRFTGGGRIDGLDTDEEPWKLYYHTFTDSDGLGSIHKLVREDRRITSTPGTAYTYADLSSNHPVLGYKLGKVDHGNIGEWIAYKVRTEDIAVATTFNFNWATWDDKPA